MASSGGVGCLLVISYLVNNSNPLIADTVDGMDPSNLEPITELEEGDEEMEAPLGEEEMGDVGEVGEVKV